jgi:hypothetical protein
MQSMFSRLGNRNELVGLSSTKIRSLNNSNNQVEVCERDLCVRAQGKNSDRIATAAVVALLLFGVGALISAFRS